jgi:hypothetical protein
MHRTGFATRLASVFSTSFLCINGILYINDTDLFAIAAFSSESAEWVACQMQAMTSHWRGCLLVTGGDLNPDKCSWTPIGFCWDDEGQWHYRNDIAMSIRIPNSSGHLQALERLSPLASMTVVCVVQAADGNMADQVAALKAIAYDLGDRVNQEYLPKRLIWQTLCSMVWPSVQYPLPSITILDEESEEITKKLYAKLIPSGRANHNFPCVFRHAPNAFFGIALSRCIDAQFIGQVKKVLVHGAIPSYTGRLFNISLEQVQMKIGIGTPILEASFEDYGHLLIFCWVKILREHLQRHKISLRCPDQVLPKLQREGDFFIMEQLVQLGGLSYDDEIHFNHCRLAYRAMTIADIITGDGTKVTKHALDLSHLSWASSKWEWPNECPCIKISYVGILD